MKDLKTFRVQAHMHKMRIRFQQRLIKVEESYRKIKDLKEIITTSLGQETTRFQILKTRRKALLFLAKINNRRLMKTQDLVPINKMIRPSLKSHQYKEEL